MNNKDLLYSTWNYTQYFVIIYKGKPWREEPTHWKRPWCWEKLKTGEGDDRGWDGWMASPTWWTRVWAGSGSWWWTRRPGMLQAMGSQRVRHDWTTTIRENNLKRNITGSLWCTPETWHSESTIFQLKRRKGERAYGSSDEIEPRKHWLRYILPSLLASSFFALVKLWWSQWRVMRFLILATCRRIKGGLWLAFGEELRLLAQQPTRSYILPITWALGLVAWPTPQVQFCEETLRQKHPAKLDPDSWPTEAIT